MNTSRIKLIISDLDQTLLRSDKTISEKTLEILSQCRLKGIFIGIATARSEKAAQTYLTQIQPDYLIADGGARVKLKNKIIYRSPLSVETTNALLKEFVCREEITKITVETDGGYLTNFTLPSSSDYAHAQYENFQRGIEWEAYKIVVDTKHPEIVETIAKKYPDCKVLSFSGESWHRIAHKNATKWTAIQALLDHLSLSPGHVCAFGDDFSDLEMIEKAGLGIAVKNGIPEIQEKAHYVTDENDNDGVANFIEVLLKGTSINSVSL